MVSVCLEAESRCEIPGGGEDRLFLKSRPEVKHIALAAIRIEAPVSIFGEVDGQSATGVRLAEWARSTELRLASKLITDSKVSQYSFKADLFSHKLKIDGVQVRREGNI